MFGLTQILANSLSISTTVTAINGLKSAPAVVVQQVPLAWPDPLVILEVPQVHRELLVLPDHKAILEEQLVPLEPQAQQVLPEQGLPAPQAQQDHPAEQQEPLVSQVT
jgi:hypothetical protein